MNLRKLSLVLLGTFCLLVNNCCASSEVQSMAKKLKAMEKNIPLPYHENLPGHVQNCGSKPVPCDFVSFSAFMETELQKRSMPLELKYLPFALSQMNPNFMNGDRKGYWSLPTVVGLRYGLNIDGQTDQRQDLEPATRAALDYLAELNTKYDNWWLSILAFANSPTALHHSLMLSDIFPALWDFDEHKLLPDTKVIGDFIAYIYLGNQGELKFSKPIQKSVTQPVAKPTEPNGSGEKPKTQEVAQDSSKKATPSKNTTTSKQNVTYYIVKRGDTLTKIAKQYKVTVNQLMKWNNLKNDKILEGQKLKIKK